MPDNLNAVGSISQSLMLQEVDGVTRTHVKRTEDSVSSAVKRERGEQVSVEMRPLLPTPGKSQHPNYLAILAEAFCKTFDAMNSGAITQTRDLAKLQELDQTMAKSVLLSTKEAVDQQDQMIKTEQKQAKYAKESENTSSTVNTIAWVLGAVVMVATVASAFLDGGLSLAALPGEIGLFSAEAGGEAATDAALEAGAESATTVELGDVSASSAAEAAASDTTTAASELTENAETDATTAGEADSAQEEGSSNSTWKKIGKRCLQMAVNGLLGAPMLVTGIQQLNLSEEYKQLAKDEKEVGGGIAKMQANNMYFQFYQKLVQRSTGVATEEVNNASEVVETFSKISNAYQQITYGLAQAV